MSRVALRLQPFLQRWPMRRSWIYWFRRCNFTEGAVCIFIVFISFLFFVWATGLTFIRILALALALVRWLGVFISFSVEEGVEEGFEFILEDHNVFGYWIERMLTAG